MTIPASIRAVLFDHDGTLVDSEPTHFSLWAEVLSAHGVCLSEEQYKCHYAGVPTATNAKDIVQRFGLAIGAAALAQAKNSATRRLLLRQAFPLMPGVPGAIGLLRGLGLRLGVVTGAGRDGVDATLRAHALAPSFATVVSGDDVRHGKPAPDCYLLAAERLGVDPRDCIAIEDTGHGVAAAVCAGMACLAVPTPMSAHHDFSKAAGRFGGLQQATAWLARHMTPARHDASYLPPLASRS